jgi:hypothetical protein
MFEAFSNNLNYLKDKITAQTKKLTPSRIK